MHYGLSLVLFIEIKTPKDEHLGVLLLKITIYKILSCRSVL